MTNEKPLEVPAGWECAIVLDQAMADAIIPRVLSKPAKGYMVWIDGITGPVDLIKSITPTDEAWEEVNAQCDANDDHEPEDFIEECKLENDWINCSRELVRNPEHVEWMAWRQRRAKTMTFSHMVRWVRVSGGLGDLAVPCHPDWIRDLRDQCAAAGVLFRFDSWGEWAPSIYGCGPNPDHLPNSAGYYFPAPYPPGKVWKFGAAASGRLLDGVEHLDAPAGAVLK